MPSCYGPCSLPGWECPDGYLPCYEDCCKRGERFCNNDENEQRCQDCALRKDQCGNFTMPPECDLYCQEILSKPDGSVQVSGAYQTITIALGVVVPVLVLVVLFVFCIWPRIKRRRQRRNQKSSIASSSNPDSDQLSLTESTTSGSSREEKVQTENLTHDTAGADQDPGTEATTSATTPLLPPQSPLPHPPTVCHDQSSLPPTQTPPSSGQNPPSPLTPGQTRIPEAPPQNVQPAEDLPRRGGEGNPGHTRPHARQSPRPGDVHPAGGPQTRVAGGPPEDARQGSSCQGCPDCHPKVCRDPRLDGIPPTEEGDRDVGTVLTNMTKYPDGQHFINR